MSETHSGKGGEHYKSNGAKEVCEHMEEEAMRIVRDEMKSSSLSAELERAIIKALWGASLRKHERRAGTKEGNSVLGELAKAENYRNRQETGEWIK